MAEDMSDILNKFQDLLQSSNSSATSNDSSPNSSSPSNSNLNITPEMISNMADTLKKFNLNSSATSNSNNSTQSKDSESSDTGPQIDIETILKIKSIIEKLNQKDDPRSNLLHSLKPYLRESRQKKLDEYSNLLKIVSLSDIFKNK